MAHLLAVEGLKVADSTDLADAPGWVLAVLFGAQVVVALSLLLMFYLTLTDRLRRNRWFGLRTKRSLASDEAWRHVHRVSAPFTAAAGLVVLVGLVPMALTVDSGPGFAVSLLVTDGLMLVLLLVGAWAGHRGLSRRSG